MKHPLLGKALSFYLAVWAIVIVLHTLILLKWYSFPLTTAAMDALIFNFLVAGLGLCYWYVVLYIPDYQKVQYIVLTHIVGVFVAVSVVVFTTNSALKAAFKNEPLYQSFLTESLLWRTTTGAFFLALIIMIYYLLQYNNNLKQKEQDELRLQHLLRHSELEALKFQINPHFIFNSLNAIKALTITAPDQAGDMIVKLSDFLRSSFAKDDIGLHTLKKELEQMNHYLEIEKVRFGERLSVTNDIDPKCETLMVPNMILQPLFENAIKFGLYEQLGEVQIKTCCRYKEGSLLLSISNNYDPDAVPQKGRGIGLKNVRSRLQLIYKLSDLLTVEKDNNRFTVHLRIPQLQQQ